jgi:hypothetical protein
LKQKGLFALIRINRYDLAARHLCKAGPDPYNRSRFGTPSFGTPKADSLSIAGQKSNGGILQQDLAVSNKLIAVGRMSLTVPQHDTYANYNALQVLYQKTTGRTNFNINYIFSKALGILGSAADFTWTAAVTPFQTQSNYGPMNFDRSQVFNASYSYSVGKRVAGRLEGAFV